jgi:hypothetical protein
MISVDDVDGDGREWVRRLLEEPTWTPDDPARVRSRAISNTFRRHGLPTVSIFQHDPQRVKEAGHVDQQRQEDVEE